MNSSGNVSGGGLNRDYRYDAIRQTAGKGPPPGHVGEIKEPRVDKIRLSLGGRFLNRLRNMGSHNVSGLSKEASIDTASRADSSSSSSIHPDPHPLGHEPSSSNHGGMELRRLPPSPISRVTSSIFEEEDQETAPPLVLSPPLTAISTPESPLILYVEGDDQSTEGMSSSVAAPSSPYGGTVGDMQLVSGGVDIDEDSQSEDAGSRLPLSGFTASKPMQMTTDQFDDAIEEAVRVKGADSPEVAKLQAEKQTFQNVSRDILQIVTAWKTPPSYDRAQFREKLDGMRAAKEQMRSQPEKFVEAKEQFDRLSGEARAMLINASSSQRRSGFDALKQLDPSLTTSYRSNLANILSSDLAKLRTLMRAGNYQYEKIFGGEKFLYSASGALGDIVDKYGERPARGVLADNPALSREFEQTYFEVGAETQAAPIQDVQKFIAETRPVVERLAVLLGAKQTAQFTTSPPAAEELPDLRPLRTLSAEEIGALPNESVKRYLEHQGVMDHSLSEGDLKSLLTTVHTAARVTIAPPSVEGQSDLPPLSTLSTENVSALPKESVERYLQHHQGVVDDNLSEGDLKSLLVEVHKQGLENSAIPIMRVAETTRWVSPTALNGSVETGRKLLKGCDELARDSASFIRHSDYKLSEGLQSRVADKLANGDYAVAFQDAAKVLINGYKAWMQTEIAWTLELAKFGIQYLQQNGRINQEEAKHLRDGLQAVTKQPDGTSRDSPDSQLLLQVVQQIGTRL